MGARPALRDLPPEVQPHQLLSRGQLSRLLAISRTTAYRMINRQKDPIPSVKIGGQRRFRLDKLLKWLDTQEEKNHD